MDAIAHHLALAYPEADKGVGIALLSMKEDMVGDVQPFLLVLLAAVAFLLLISCANVASLLLARSMSRSGEFALRASLGASRSRIIRQLLTESLLLAGLGGTLGFCSRSSVPRPSSGCCPARFRVPARFPSTHACCCLPSACLYWAELSSASHPRSGPRAPICSRFCGKAAGARATRAIACKGSCCC